MKPIFNYIFVLCLCALVGCRTRQPTPRINNALKDSVFVHTNYIKKDTTIIVKGDTLRLDIPTYSLTPKPIVLKQNGLNMILSRVEDTIKAHCYTDELERIITLQNQIITRYQSRNLEQTNEVIIKHVPLFYKIFALLGFAFLMIIVGALISRIRIF